MKFKLKKNKNEPINPKSKIELENFIEEDSNDDLHKLISIKNLQKKFGKKQVLKDVNFNIKKGEHLCLLGSNGAGKTVLIETISGLLEPSGGSIEYFFDSTELNKQIGIQFQSIDLPSSLTPLDIINFFIDLYKLNITKEEIDNLIDAFKIRNYINTKSSKLSGGQKQRLNVLLSLINKPKIIFLDEFSTGLDFLIKNQIEEFILNYANKNNITIVVVSHDVDEINFFAKRIVVLYDGKIVLNISKEKAIEKFGSIRNLMKNYIT